MRGHFGGSVDPWRGITAIALVTAAALIAAVFSVMATLILHQDK